MAASAEIEPRRSLLLLSEVKYLYGKYLEFFPPVPASGKKLAHTLSSLKDGISRYNFKYNTGNGTPLVFHHLTLGLSDSLITLQRGLRSCASEYGSDTLDANDCQFELDSESMEGFQTRLHPISMGVEIINEAMEMLVHNEISRTVHTLTLDRVLIESSGIRSSETIEEICKRIDEAKNSPARLSRLLDSFIYGITSQTKLETTDGRDLHTFTSANISHREVGQKIATRLRQETEKAVSIKPKDEGELAWMMRHSVYWLSKSSEDLREWQSDNGFALSIASERARHTIAKTFLDAIKAAWLLCDLGDLQAYEEPSSEIREVVACAKKKVLSLLQSFYRDIFTVPNYDLINDVGDFDMSTDDERKQKASKSSDSNSNLSTLVSEPGTMHRMSEDSTLPAELEAGSLVSLTDSDSHESPSQLTLTPVKSTRSIAFRTNAESVNTADIPALADGLHITHLEAPAVDHKNIDHTPAGLHYNELCNEETAPFQNEWSGFQYNLFSKDSNPPHSTAFIPTRVRIFKLDNSQASSYLRLEINREALPMSQSVVKLSTTALVPTYAFAADRSESAELYLSDSGMQPNLRYQFICKDSNGDHHPWELYGFQGALMGAKFESEYKAVSVSMHRCGSQVAESERFPQIQIWTDFPGDQPAISDLSSPESRSMTSPSSCSTQSSISSKEFSALTSHVTHNVNDTKIFIFSQNFIYVLFGPFPLPPTPPVSHPQIKCLC